MKEEKFKFPSEEVELPSKGLIYPEDNPLSSGKVEVKYMTAKEEDILTNENYIKKGIVLDKLLQSVIISDISYNDLIIGDKNAILVATRILGYGKDYTFEYKGETVTVDLTEIDLNYLDESSITKGVNQFSFTLPHSKTEVTYKILNQHDDIKIKQELKGIKKINKNSSPELSTRLKYIITSVGGDDDRKTIREFVEKHLLARDSRALREHIKASQPDIDLTFSFTNDNGEEEDARIPMTAGFFWPDAGV
tara:strand:+ start:226 stop:975 length:750 start_codon:yes stop_codon:yes gene_type:complete